MCPMQANSAIEKYSLLKTHNYCTLTRCWWYDYLNEKIKYQRKKKKLKYLKLNSLI